ncbi:MAG: substrate-binding domain-containing protein [Alphaproteobacteria bacterium]
MRRSGKIFRSIMLVLAGLAGLSAAAATPVSAEAPRAIRLASTTSTDNSGLFAHLLPIFESDTGIKVHVIAVGTGQAIRIARNGDADVLLVHHKPSEEAFVAGGHGVKRYDVMYNDFVIVGPRADPAGIRGLKDATEALLKIAELAEPFASRGDDSGTHKAERDLWRAAGVNVKAASGSWYRETGSGMGATLNTAAGMSAYTISDRATWISFKNKRTLELLVEGDKKLFNQYGVILVNPKKHGHVGAAEGKRFIAWLLSEAGQKAIAAFRVQGQQLFFPNAATPPS